MPPGRWRFGKRSSCLACGRAVLCPDMDVVVPMDWDESMRARTAEPMLLARVWAVLSGPTLSGKLRAGGTVDMAGAEGGGREP
jgi:hypothetical protein